MWRRWENVNLATVRGSDLGIEERGRVLSTICILQSRNMQTPGGEAVVEGRLRSMEYTWMQCTSIAR